MEVFYLNSFWINNFKTKEYLTLDKDLNVIITPLYFWIGYLIFEIFGANYLIYFIVYMFMLTVIIILI